MENNDEIEILCQENKILFKNISNAIIRSLILWNLTKKEQHGYELTKKINEFFKPQIEKNIIKNIPTSKTYPILKKLEKQKLIESYEGTNNNKKIKIYKITKKGETIHNKVKKELKNTINREIFKEYIDYMLK